MFGTLGWIVATVIVFIVAGTAAWAGWRAAPFVPTRQRDVERMLRLADVRPGEVVYDLGAGDGRFVVAAARRGARAVGFEISLLPYLVARARLLITHVSRAGEMRFQDFFHQDLSTADVVVCFLTPPAMKKLGEKFTKELRPGTRIVSYAFAIHDWTPELKDKPNPSTMAVYLYRR